MTTSTGRPAEPEPEHATEVEDGTVEGPPPDRSRRVPLFFAHPSDFGSPEEMAAALHQAILGSGRGAEDEEE